MTWRSLVLVLAAAAAGAALFKPTAIRPRDTYRMLFVLDITQSMKARDYELEGVPVERLEYARRAIREVLDHLPCGSEAGLGVFTTQNVEILFEPLEICAHFPVIAEVLAHIDWRMAWSANSHIAQGVYGVVRELQRRDAKTRLVFFTDGQETPPLAIRPQFNGKVGALKGHLIGTGGVQPVTVPRYDRENRSLGVWENRDIDPPPLASTDYSDKVEVKSLPREGAYLSWLDERHLLELASTTGLRYHRLEDPDDLVRALLTADQADRRQTVIDLRPWLGSAALFLLLWVDGIVTVFTARRT